MIHPFTPDAEMARRALLIINSKSRTGKAASNAAIDGLRRHGVDAVHRECGNREQLSPLIAEHGRDVDMVVIGGGISSLGAPLLDGVKAVLAHRATESPFLASLELADRVRLVPAGFPSAAVGAALVGAASIGGIVVGAA